MDDKKFEISHHNEEPKFYFLIGNDKTGPIWIKFEFLANLFSAFLAKI